MSKKKPGSGVFDRIQSETVEAAGDFNLIEDLQMSMVREDITRLGSPIQIGKRTYTHIDDEGNHWRCDENSCLSKTRNRF